MWRDDKWLLVKKSLVYSVVCISKGAGGILPQKIFVFLTPMTAFCAFFEIDFWIYTPYIIL